MQAVDITGLSPSAVSSLENDPSRYIQPGPNGIGMPIGLPMGPQPGEVNIKKNKKNIAVITKWGDRVFDKHGKIVLTRLPKEEILRRLVRNKQDSRAKLLGRLGVDFVTKMYNSGVIQKSSMTMKNQKEVMKACEKFTGLTPKKSAEERAALRKRKEKARRHLKKQHEKSKEREKTKPSSKDMSE